MVLVIGATGKVGRHVVSGLLDQGAAVRALARDPATAGLPDGAQVLRGDLSDVTALEQHLAGVQAVFLVWPFFSDDGAGEVVDAIARYTGTVVYLSAEAAGGKPDSFWAKVERRIERAGVQWTFLRPTGFAANTLMWAEQIREVGVVRWPYGDAARSLIHERDIAAVAVRALTQDGHANARYVLTGPETLTQIEQVQAIGDAIGRPLGWEEISPEDFRAQLPELPESALDTWASFIEHPEIVTQTVEELTGQPARPFAQWAREHAEDFR